MYEPTIASQMSLISKLANLNTGASLSLGQGHVGAKVSQQRSGPIKKQHGRSPLTHCILCKSNGEQDDFVKSHTLRDESNNVTCPVLKRYTCPKCGVTGDHTLSYCGNSKRYAHSVGYVLYNRKRSTDLKQITCTTTTTTTNNNNNNNNGVPNGPLTINAILPTPSPDSSDTSDTIKLSNKKQTLSGKSAPRLPPAVAPPQMLIPGQTSCDLVRADLARQTPTKLKPHIAQQVTIALQKIGEPKSWCEIMSREAGTNDKLPVKQQQVAKAAAAVVPALGADSPHTIEDQARLSMLGQAIALARQEPIGEKSHLFSCPHCSNSIKFFFGQA